MALKRKHKTDLRRLAFIYFYLFIPLITVSFFFMGKLTYFPKSWTTTQFDRGVSRVTCNIASW